MATYYAHVFHRIMAKLQPLQTLNKKLVQNLMAGSNNAKLVKQVMATQLHLEKSADHSIALLHA